VTDLLKTKDFYSSEEVKHLHDRVISHKDLATKQDNLLHFIGYPYYVNMMNKIPRDPTKVKAFNDVMKLHFSDVLKKLISFFETELGETVYIDERISYPGFHLIKIPAMGESMINFHQDTEYLDIGRDFPDLMIDPKKPGPSFTILLSQEPDLNAGLLYLEGPGFTHEKLVGGAGRSQGLRALSSYFPYTPGMINIHSELAHSVFAQNISKDVLLRVSLQGHLIKTIRGYLLFW
jgi:hypothetical protein